MRNQFSRTLEAVGNVDPNLVVLVGDISVFLLRNFQQKYPDRFYNIGILEQAMVSIAAGFAEQGFYPVVHTISPFLVERAYEQIKNDLCYQGLGVNLITVGAAFDYVPDGPTHHNYNDFCILRVLPRMEVVSPGTPMEFDLLFKQTYNNGNPTYFRLSGASSGIEHPADKIVFGKGIVVKEGKKLLIVVVGPRLGNVMEAVKGEDVEVVYIHTLKPFDYDLVRQEARKIKKVVCVEEHNKVGGLGGLVAEAVEDISGVTITRLGIPDQFLDSYGGFDEISKDIGIDTNNIRETIIKCIEKY